MIIKLKPKPYYFIYKRYKLDVWGILKTTLYSNSFYEEDKFKKPMPFRLSKKIEWIHNFFYLKHVERWKYNLDKYRRYVYIIERTFKIRYKKHRIIKRLLTLYLVQLFYVVLNQKNFRRLAIKAKNKDGYYELNFIWLLEGRIVSVIYRANFIGNMFESIRFVQAGFTWIDKVFVRYINCLIKLMVFIGFDPFIKGTIYWNLVRRLSRHALLNSKPNYMFFSDVFLTFFLKRLPNPKELVNPVAIDIYRATGYNH